MRYNPIPLLRTKFLVIEGESAKYKMNGHSFNYITLISVIGFPEIQIQFFARENVCPKFMRHLF